MLKALRSNPLLDQTLRASRWPSPRVTIVLLIALLTGATAGRAWLTRHLPAEARTMLLLLLWLLPLATMAVAAVSTARRLRSESFQLVRQSPLTDSRVTWGLGLSALYYLRVILVLAFGLLLALIDDTPLGGASTALCLASLHLAASMLGTVLVLRWGRQRLGVVLAGLGSLQMLILLPTLSIFVPGCTSPSLIPDQLRLSAILLRWGLHGPLSLASAAILSILVGWMASLILWRGRNEGWRPQLESLGLTLAVGLTLGLWVIDASEAREHRALVALYEATEGENWSHKDGWLSNQSVCTWYGVTCACGRVVTLNLEDNNLQRELPSEIGQLTDLQVLELFRNQLTGLPPEIGQLTDLQALDLSVNQLTELPPEIGQLASLQKLDLYGNQLTTLPSEIGQLTSLQDLVLLYNQLTMLPPEIGYLARLQSLHLFHNQLTELPPEIGQLTSLQALILYDNQLTELPPEIGQLTSLDTLYLGNNQLIELPPEIRHLTNLEYLDLNNTLLSANLKGQRQQVGDDGREYLWVNGQ